LKQAVTEGERWGPLHRECAERLREQDLIIGEQFNSSTKMERLASRDIGEIMMPSIYCSTV